MAFLSEITAKLGLDTTGLNAALTRATADVGRAGDDIGRKLNRAFGAGDVFKGLLQGLGIQSVQSLVDKLTEGFKEAADHAKEIEKTTAETATIYERIFAARRTDQQNLDKAREKDARLAREAAQIQEEAAKPIETTTMGPNFQVRTTIAAGKLTQEQEQRLFEIAKERASVMEEIEKLTRSVAKADEQHSQQLQRDTDAYAKAQADLDRQRRDFEREQMSNEDALREAVKDKIELEASLADDIAISDEEQIERKKRILDLDRQIQRTQEKIVEDNIKAAEAQIRNEKALKDAQNRVTEGRAALRDARLDRSGFTVSELAQGGRGITQSTKATAREILRLENQARRQRAQGFEVSAEKSMERAEKLRSGLGLLTAAERNPLGAQLKVLKDSEKHLKDIKASLIPVNTE
jgi:hypothetical protein